MPHDLTLTYPAIYHEDDNYVYIEVPDLGIEEFTIPLENKANMVDIIWDLGSQKLMDFIRNGKPLPQSKSLDDLEVFEGNEKDAFLLEYIRK